MIYRLESFIANKEHYFLFSAGNFHELNQSSVSHTAGLPNIQTRKVPSSDLFESRVNAISSPDHKSTLEFPFPMQVFRASIKLAAADDFPLMPIVIAQLVVADLNYLDLP